MRERQSSGTKERNLTHDLVRKTYGFDDVRGKKVGRDRENWWDRRERREKANTKNCENYTTEQNVRIHQMQFSAVTIECLLASSTRER